MMMLQMYVGDILIDSLEVNFLLCNTLKKRDESVLDLCSFMAKEHFEKSFIAHQKPHFIITAPSKANDIILEDEFENRLVPELENELEKLKKLQRNKLRICK